MAILTLATLTMAPYCSPSQVYLLTMGYTYYGYTYSTYTYHGSLLPTLAGLFEIFFSIPLAMFAWMLCGPIALALALALAFALAPSLPLPLPYP